MAPRIGAGEIALRRIEAQQHAVLVADDGEGDRGIGHGETLHGVHRLVALAAHRLHEFEARRRRIEEVAHLDARAGRMRRGLRRRLDAAVDGERPGCFGAAAPARQPEPAHRADRGQRLAAESEAPDAQEIVLGQLRGAVTLDGERELVPRHALAVIADGDEALAAVAQHHLDAARAGVDRVLDQLLHRRGGALHHLAGGDAVDQDRRQLANRHGTYCALYRAAALWLRQRRALSPR